MDAAGDKKLKREAPQAPEKWKMGRRRSRKVWKMVVYGAEGAGKIWNSISKKLDFWEGKFGATTYKGGGL